jgi:hypothetical protein
VFSNGNSFAIGDERRNTEPWYIRILSGIQPGALGDGIHD